jgi:hypothetical protein
MFFYSEAIEQIGPTDPSFSNVSLLLKAAGANNSTSFVDSSANSFAISRFGNTKISTADSKYGGSSAFFDGSGDYLSAANNAAFNFGSGDFTIEMWLNPTAPTNWNQKHLFAKRATGSVFGLLCYISRNSTTGRYSVTMNIPNAAGNGWAISRNVPISFTGWSHFALVRSGNEWSIYIDGVKDVLNANLSLTIPSNTAALTIGADSAAAAGPGNNGYVGYMDDIRITKGVARYTANFTPPGSHPVVDPYFANVSLLMKADGANNSTTFVDSSTNAFAVSRTGNTVISTTQSKYGGSSAYFDGNGDYLSLGAQAAAAPFGLGTGNFTIEAWIKPDSTANNGAIYGNYGRAVGGANRDGSHILRLSSGKMQLYVFTAAATVDLQSTSTIPTNAWTHVAITRSGTTVRMFVNGVLESTLTSSVDLTSDPVNPPTAGAYWQFADAIEPTSYFNGYIDDLRITKGVARYTANFTPPDAL